MKLSVLMAAFNEEQWIEKSVQRVLEQKINGIREMELIIVDDCSTDRTWEIIRFLEKKYPGRIIPVQHNKNQGKGAGIRSAVQVMTGDICIIHDADLEYDPAEFSLVLGPIIDGRADCVFGSRFTGTQAKRVLYFWHYVGNKFITFLTNIVSNLNYTDIETCYKAFRSNIIKTIPIRSQDFGFEPEIAVKISQKKCRIYEVGISYSGRTYQEGKKIKWVDGIKAIMTILRFSLIKDIG